MWLAAEFTGISDLHVHPGWGAAVLAVAAARPWRPRWPPAVSTEHAGVSSSFRAWPDCRRVLSMKSLLPASLPGHCSESRACRGRAGRRPDPHRARLADALVGVGVIIAARAAWEPCGSHPWQAQHYPWPDHDVDSTTEDEIRERLWVSAAPDSNSGAQPPEVLRRTAELSRRAGGSGSHRAGPAASRNARNPLARSCACGSG